MDKSLDITPVRVKCTKLGQMRWSDWWIVGRFIYRLIYGIIREDVYYSSSPKGTSGARRRS
jgi:hypothetical protein